MKFQDLFLPKWRRSDPKMRIAGIKGISAQRLLARIARQDEDEFVRATAVEKITDPPLLLQLVKTNCYVDTRIAAIEKYDIRAAQNCELEDILTHMVEARDDIRLRMAALKKLGRITITPGIFEIFLRIAKYDADGELGIEALNHLARAASRGVEKTKSVLEDLAYDAVNTNVRVAAIDRLDRSPFMFIRLAMNDADPRVRLAALSKIAVDQRALIDFVVRAQDRSLRLAAIGKMVEGFSDEGLEQVVSHDPDPKIRSAAFEKVTHQKGLAVIAAEGRDASIRLAAFEKVTDPGLLSVIAEKGRDAAIRLAAVERLSVHHMKAVAGQTAVQRRFSQDNKAFVDRVTLDPDTGVRLAALRNITDPGVLRPIAENDTDADVRLAAVEKLTVHVAPRVLSDRARLDTDSRVRRAAVERLTTQPVVKLGFLNYSQSALTWVAENDTDESVRMAAVNKITPITTISYHETRFDDSCGDFVPESHWPIHNETLATKMAETIATDYVWSGRRCKIAVDETLKESAIWKARYCSHEDRMETEERVSRARFFKAKPDNKDKQPYEVIIKTNFITTVPMILGELHERRASELFGNFTDNEIDVRYFWGLGPPDQWAHFGVGVADGRSGRYWVLDLSR